MKLDRVRRVVGWLLCIGVGTLGALSPRALVGQDYSALRINEVIANNNTQGPADVRGGHPDMVEIYNSGDEILDLGFSQSASSIGLSDTLELPAEAPGLWDVS